jgi:hypothetical protein
MLRSLTESDYSKAHARLVRQPHSSRRSVSYRATSLSPDLGVFRTISGFRWFAGVNDRSMRRVVAYQDARVRSPPPIALLFTSSCFKT